MIFIGIIMKQKHENVPLERSRPERSVLYKFFHPKEMFVSTILGFDSKKNGKQAPNSRSESSETVSL